MGNVHGFFAPVVRALLDRYGQPDIALVRPGAPTGPDYDPQPGAPTTTPLPRASARGVQARYVDGLIRATDLQVTVEPWGFAPTLADQISIGGVLHEIVSIRRIPSAGVVTAWMIFVRA